MVRITLSREDWLAAGFRTLAESGPASVQIGILAKAVGATKGSFYWHFKDIAEFKSAMLGLWKDKVAHEVIENVMSVSDPRERLTLLLTEATRAAPEEFGGRKVEPAMRAYALSDPDASAALAELDSQRRAFLAELLKEVGHTDPALPDLLYGAYIGLDDLASKGRADMGAAFNTLLKLLAVKPD